MADGVVEAAADRYGRHDPALGVEVAAAALVSASMTRAGLDVRMLAGLVRRFESRGDSTALGVLQAIAAVACHRVEETAAAAARRLAKAGVEAPPWADELAEPAALRECWRVPSPDGAASMLGGVFVRAGRCHGFVAFADHLNCGAATDVLLVLGDALAEARQVALAHADQPGAQLITLEPGDFRWHVEAALDARQAHHQQPCEAPLSRRPAGNAPHAVHAVLLRTRMKTLPESPRPMPPCRHTGG